MILSRTKPIHFFALALILGACATSRDAVLSRTLAGLDAAHKSFAEVDEQRQMAIVDHAPSLEAGKAALVTYRAQRNKIQDTFIAAYDGVAVASLDPSDANIARLMSLVAAAVSAHKGWTP